MKQHILCWAENDVVGRQPGSDRLSRWAERTVRRKDDKFIIHSSVYYILYLPSICHLYIFINPNLVILSPQQLSCKCMLPFYHKQYYSSVSEERERGCKCYVFTTGFGYFTMLYGRKTKERKKGYKWVSEWVRERERERERESWLGFIGGKQKREFLDPCIFLSLSLSLSLSHPFFIPLDK